jgi:ubiquinone biosynthesis protein UbiJ
MIPKKHKIPITEGSDELSQLHEDLEVNYEQIVRLTKVVDRLKQRLSSLCFKRQEIINKLGEK